MPSKIIAGPPFRVGEQVTGEYFTDRATEVARILRALREPTRLLVYGARRQGKSSAIRQASARRDSEEGVVLWVDLSTAARLDDLTNRLLATIPFRWVGLEELLRGLSVRVDARTDPAGNPILGLALERRPPALAGQQEELRRLIEDLDSLAERTATTVALVLDEFQAIRSLAGRRGEWFLRDLMQTTHHLSFICAGSAIGVIDEILSPREAFYRFFEVLPFGPIDPDHLSRWIVSRIEGAGLKAVEDVGHRIVELVGPRTQDCLQLALDVFQLGLPLGAVDADVVLEAARRAVLREEDRFRSIWGGLSGPQQAVLRAVAFEEEAIYSEEVRRRHDLPSAATVQSAIRALRAKRVLSEEREGLAVDDPYLRHWVLMRATRDGVPRTPIAG